MENRTPTDPLSDRETPAQSDKAKVTYTIHKVIIINQNSSYLTNTIFIKTYFKK